MGESGGRREVLRGINVGLSANTGNTGLSGRWGQACAPPHERGGKRLRKREWTTSEVGGTGIQKHRR